MANGGRRLSERVVATVADVLDEDPLELPPLEDTLSADALDYLFHRENHPPGAYTVFPYSDVWVVVHSDGTVDVFDSYRATSTGEQLPDGVEPATDERTAVLHVGDEWYTLYEDQLDDLHRIVSEAGSCDEAWEDAIEYARDRAD